MDVREPTFEFFCYVPYGLESIGFYLGKNLIPQDAGIGMNVSDIHQDAGVDQMKCLLTRHPPVLSGVPLWSA
jgi:hypothetical protein